jgi:hypothetical protein
VEFLRYQRPDFALGLLDARYFDTKLDTSKNAVLTAD